MTSRWHKDIFLPSFLQYAARIVAGLCIFSFAVSCQGDEIEIDKPVRPDGPAFNVAHGLKDEAFELTMSAMSGQQGEIYYTTDGSVPDDRSMRYSGPVTIGATTVVRAVEKFGKGRYSRTSTVSYLFADDILDATSSPEGYPAVWGPYSQIDGRARADYGMDPVMTGDPGLRARMIEGLRQIPIVSIVTDRDNLFSDSSDPAKGGIYIHTGSPVGDGTGRGWERPVSVEIFGGEGLDATAACGLRIHGGHSRLAEKNPKHAFRLSFKTGYGPDRLDCPVFGADGPSQYKTLVLRTFFGNSWQHWTEDNRQRAQYVRDMWHRSASAQLGMPYSRGRHVHLFLNGMYWGIYCLSERIDENYCQTHFGGSAADYDVIKVDETHGNAAVASSGSAAAYAELMAAPAQEALKMVDTRNFIDFIILNQYAGNTDWDYHNWFAIRNSRTQDGFRFLVWDSELIFGSLQENILGVRNSGKPTALFAKLMQEEAFRLQFSARVRELTSAGGLLTQEGTVALWDSLYHSIDKALYLEAARWGDYRYSVHPYSSQGRRYDVDNWYMRERERLLTGYFPERTQVYISQLREKGWYEDNAAAANGQSLSGRP